ncbi:MAG TPA: PIN domain-containing protein [Nitrososphaerales archaeon]|nr:PIN domain-containing protein [Nitrososphaerales archaeon]
MTVVADTRLLIVHAFPVDEDERARIGELMRHSLRERLIIPAVVVTEFFKTAGKEIGKQGASTQISLLKEHGGVISDIDEGIALLAGELLLKDNKRSIGDSLIAATALHLHASHVVSDDPHFLEFGLKTKWMA